MLRCLENIATFMEALPMDSPSNLWTTISNQFQTFLTKLPCVLPLKVWYMDIGNELYCHWSEYTKMGESCGWEITASCCECFLMIQLMCPEDWIYCMSDPSLYLYFLWITLTTLTTLLFSSLLAFFLYVFHALRLRESAFWQKRKKNPLILTVKTKLKLSGRAALPN